MKQQGSITHVNDKGQLIQLQHEEWVVVEGYFTKEPMLQLLTKAYQGKVQECETLNHIIWPIKSQSC
jgi:hypothetical protein